eukprot:CAMPEP_0202896768 /NCGR_PEP_ID=MMETSP1392-20130828/5695_1 /ASSEMBLY_ACC=CAM_ASM_000868 /TAXON_ID=225041 /ORGANISM="Chlamydomonas chlamydogama, Strain SAG 11-48b" /LENGTH=170 /DNA_ID=CAMNT_0049582231 /DNA_START=27 /DNA_END=539 /DNA_ORIENTATION=+
MAYFTTLMALHAHHQVLSKCARTLMEQAAPCSRSSLPSTHSPQLPPLLLLVHWVLDLACLTLLPRIRTPLLTPFEGHGVQQHHNILPLAAGGPRPHEHKPPSQFAKPCLVLLNHVVDALSPLLHPLLAPHDAAASDEQVAKASSKTAVAELHETLGNDAGVAGMCFCQGK